MKSSQIFVIIFCLSLVLVAAGCTDSKTDSSENAQATEPPTPTTQPSIEQINTNQNSSTPSGQNLNNESYHLKEYKKYEKMPL